MGESSSMVWREGRGGVKHACVLTVETYFTYFHGDVNTRIYSYETLKQENVATFATRFV